MKPRTFPRVRLLVLLSSLFMAEVPAKCEHPWMFFDLGENTLIATDGRDRNGEIVDMHYRDGAREYLADLKSKGYPLGLIINFPAGEGFSGLVAYLKRPGGWREGAAPFDFTLFDGNILLPAVDDERKPNHAPPYDPRELTLFREAARRASEAGCPAIYQTGIANEVPAAKRAGLYARFVPKTGRDRFLVESLIPAFVAAPSPLK